MTSLHIELTNRCTLECPACPRTIWKKILNKPVPKHDLSITSLENFLDCTGGENIDTFILCGDYGDCIYYPHFLEFIKKFRHKKFSIHTNGSYKNESFWLELSELLTDQDSITFGIDGLEDSNYLYRKNSDWQSIMNGLNIMVKSQAKVYWQTIVFSFNQHNLHKIKSFATEQGANFFAIKSHRFGEDSLVPEHNLIEHNYVWKDEFSNNTPIKLEPQCNTNFANSISSDGYFLPCNWIRHPNTFYKSDLWKDKEQWLNRLKIDQINLDIGRKVIEEWYQLVIKRGETGDPRLDPLCKMLCRAGCRSSNIVEI